MLNALLSMELLFAIRLMMLCALLAGARAQPALEEEYNAMITKRHELKDDLNDAFSHFDPWKYFRQAWPCPTTRRYGTLDDGGKYLCFLPQDCTLLSIGINNEYSFESELVKEHGCTAYGYDPTIDPTLELLSVVTFHKRGVRGTPSNWNGVVAGQDAGSMSIREMLAQNNKTRVDILKVDVEGAEFGMFEELFRDYPIDNATLPFDQLLVEFHLFRASYHTVGQIVGIVERLEAYGFRLYETELNQDNPKCCAELAFVHKDAHAKEFRVWYLIDQAVHHARREQ